MQKNSKQKVYTIASAFLLTASTFSISEAHAQSNADSLSDVIISASRRPEVANRAAVTVQVIKREQILQIAQFNPDVSSILGYLVPGMGMQTNTTSNRSQTMRGRTPLILIDGIPQTTPLRVSDRDIRSIDPSVISRIEIIKGATSIYGNGASGGIINIITLSADSHTKIEGRSTVGFSSHKVGDQMFGKTGGGGYRITQQLDGKLGKFDYVVSGALRQTGVMLDGKGQVISPRYGLGETKTWNAFAKLGYQINSKSRLQLMYNYFRSQQNTDYAIQNGVYLSQPSIGVLGKHLGANEGTPYNHNASLSYINNEIFKNTSLEVDGYYKNFYTIFDYRSAPRWQTGGQSTIKDRKYGFRATFNTHLEFSPSAYTSLVYGVDGLIDKTAQPLVDGRLWVPWLTSNNMAPFLQTKTTLWKDLIVKAGVRYDYVQVKIPNYTTVPNDANFVNVAAGQINYRKTTFNAGLAYTHWAYFQPYASFSQSFSISDLGRVLRSADANTVSELNTTPILTNNYEAGFNSFIGKKLKLSGSVFRSTSQLGSDLIIVDGYWTPQRAPQHIWGWEMDAAYHFNNRLSADASYSWQEGKSDTANNGHYDHYLSGLLIAPAKLNAHIAYSPISKLNVNLYYIHSFGRNRFAPVAGVYNEGEGIVKSIDLFNINATYAFSKAWGLNIGIENLFNNTYYTQTSMLTASDQEYAHGNGLYYTTTVSYRF